MTSVTGSGSERLYAVCLEKADMISHLMMFTVTMLYLINIGVYYLPNKAAQKAALSYSYMAWLMFCLTAGVLSGRY